MNSRDRRDDWTAIAAIVLIALGVWFLLDNFIPGFHASVWRFLRLAWPIGLVAIGVLLYVSSTRPHPEGGKRLYRSRSQRMLAGVMGGVAAYLGVEPTLARVVYVFFGVLAGFWPAVLIYVIAMMIVPEEPVGGAAASPSASWPSAGGGRGSSGASSPKPPSAPGSGSWSQSGGWPHNTETVQTPPPPPASDAGSSPGESGEGDR